MTIVYDAIIDRPKSQAPRNPEVIQKTQFDFGFAYGGSLGIALVIEHDRQLVDSELDRAIAAVFDMMKSGTSEEIHDVAIQYGRASVRKLYSWSKTHSSYGLTADIKWVREGSAHKELLVQPKELAEICRIIESRSEPDTDPVDIVGTLVAWDSPHRRFIIDVPDADPIKGQISERIDVSQERTVQIRYAFNLLKHTVTDYSLDQDKVTWELIGLNELK